MKVIIDKKAGFCFGVRRAIDLIISELEKGKIVYTLGPLIHNPQEVNRLKSLGVKVLDKLNGRIEGVIVIRTHGISPQDYEDLRKKASVIIDGTCPLVKRSHFVAEKLRAEGYRIIIIGDKNHPEVIALKGYAGPNAIIIKDKNELENFSIGGKIGVIAQTTLSKETVQDILSYLTTKIIELKYYNTLCGITLNQKKSALQLAKQVNKLIVVGGYNSSNTTKLAEICKEVQPNTYLIESHKDLQSTWFKPDDTVGVTAGASTPTWVIEQVIQELENISRYFTRNQITVP
jgi:4-hydroxy-3-methylbut-2-enyl diphosphate reductase